MQLNAKLNILKNSSFFTLEIILKGLEERTYFVNIFKLPLISQINLFAKKKLSVQSLMCC